LSVERAILAAMTEEQPRETRPAGVVIAAARDPAVCVVSAASARRW